MFLSMHLSRNESGRCKLAGLNTETFKPWLTRMDLQRAEYIRQHYGRDWLDPMLYDLCVSTSIGLDRATTLINDAVVFPDTNWTPTADEEVSLCPSLDQL
jgi:hypothetical protein